MDNVIHQKEKATPLAAKLGGMWFLKNAVVHVITANGQWLQSWWPQDR